MNTPLQQKTCLPAGKACELGHNPERKCFWVIVRDEASKRVVYHRQYTTRLEASEAARDRGFDNALVEHCYAQWNPRFN